MQLEQVRKELSKRKITEVRDATGLSYPTILNIRNGRNKNPQTKTLEILTKHLVKG